MHSDQQSKESGTDLEQGEDLEQSDTQMFEAEETVVMPKTAQTDNVGDVSVEINVEELVAKVEAEQDDDAARKQALRHKLEDIAEDQGFESTYAVEFNKD